MNKQSKQVNQWNETIEKVKNFYEESEWELGF